MYLISNSMYYIIYHNIVLLQRRLAWKWLETYTVNERRWNDQDTEYDMHRCSPCLSVNKGHCVMLTPHLVNPLMLKIDNADQPVRPVMGGSHLYYTHCHNIWSAGHTMNACIPLTHSQLTSYACVSSPYWLAAHSMVNYIWLYHSVIHPVWGH